MKLVRILAMAAALATMMCAAKVAEAQDYWVRNLELRTGRSVNIHGVNRTGSVVGEAWTPGTEAWVAFLYRNNSISDLPPLPGGGVENWARAVNDLDQVVGSAQTGGIDGTGQPLYHAVLWTSSGITDLGTIPGDSGSYANGINRSGQVVGTSNGVDAQGAWRSHAFLWDRATGMHDISPSGQFSAANAINASGQVAGWTLVGGVQRPFLWTPNNPNGITGSAALLDTRAGYATSINDAGIVVGATVIPVYDLPMAVLWDSSRTAHDLSPLGGGTYSEARGINNSGQVVGYSAYNEGVDQNGEGGGAFYTPVLWGTSLIPRSLFSLAAVGDYLDDSVEKVDAIGDGGQFAAGGMLFIPIDAPELYQINCGGLTVGIFAPDHSFFNEGMTGSTTAVIDTTNVTNPAPMVVYQSFRYSATQFDYRFPGLTAGGAYKVRLHFQEAGWNSAGKRLFNVSSSGSALLTSFDVFTAAGGMLKAVVKEVRVVADISGKINLSFTGTPGAVDPTPFVCAIEVLTDVPIAPQTPTGLTATAGDRQVSLAWNDSAGAATYRVKRSATIGGPYNLLATVAGRSCLDTGLTNGTTYYYVVSAGNSAGESPNSSEVSARPFLPPPAAPTALTATGYGGRAPRNVVLSWKQSAGAGVVRNMIYRSTNSGGSYTIRDTIKVGTSYVDRSIVGGVTYYYVVTAVRSTGQESAYSNQASARIR